MRPSDVSLAASLSKKLDKIALTDFSLNQSLCSVSKAVLIEQVVESIRRVKYIEMITLGHCDDDHLDPQSSRFDPYKAAQHWFKTGDIDEAFWLIFLSVHCGKHRREKWATFQDLYGMLGNGKWGWEQISINTGGFVDWLQKNQANIRSRFGNHRKYQSLDAASDSGTGSAIVTYVNWVTDSGGHAKMIETVLNSAQNGRDNAFDVLYKKMSTVASFGRTARFDYLTMLSKMKFAAIEPRSIYLTGATGPLSGARLLLGGGLSASTMDRRIMRISDELGVATHVMEDALCNWQKSPMSLVRFRG